MDLASCDENDNYSKPSCVSGLVGFHRRSESTVFENRFGRIRQRDATGQGGQNVRTAGHIHRHADAGRHTSHVRDGQTASQLLRALALRVRVPDAAGRGQSEHDQDAPQDFPEHDHRLFRARGRLLYNDRFGSARC